MLSYDECRKILGRPELTDEQVEQIRDSLYAFAHAMIDDYIKNGRKLRKEDGMSSTPT